MLIILDSGAELQIQAVQGGFQLSEVTAFSPCNPCQESHHISNIGKVHKDFKGVVEEILVFALEEWEELSIKDMSAIIKSTMQRIEEYFQQHSEYLAGL